MKVKLKTGLVRKKYNQVKGLMSPCIFCADSKWLRFCGGELLF